MHSHYLPRNALLIVLSIILYTATHSSIRPNISPTILFVSAQTECSSDDQTCSSPRCQINTHDNCSTKEIEYITKMKSKSSQERKGQIDRLKELLSRDEKDINTDLVPWIQDRLYILYGLEGMNVSELTSAAADISDTNVASDTQQSTETTNQPEPRLITAEELAEHVTEEKRIWLSILGKVYDVTTGMAYYGPESGSYKFYAGRDASPSFSSGKNNAEGAAEALEEWEGKKLLAILEWSEFYEKHETYEYLGLLVGSKYYDEDGNETDVRKTIIEKAEEAKVVAEREKEEKKKARLEKKKKLQEEREKKKKKQA